MPDDANILFREGEHIRDPQGVTLAIAIRGALRWDPLIGADDFTFPPLASCAGYESEAQRMDAVRDIISARAAHGVPSASDARVANNTVRHQYRTLSDDEKARMLEVKDMGAAFINKLHEIGGTADSAVDRQASRDLSLAQTHVEDAVMRAVRHITG